MKTLRKLHLYLGCVFAPLIIYFSLSGAWQVLRWNNIPQDTKPSAMNSFFHELSKPHTRSTFPGANPKEDQSAVFNWIVLLMGIGMVVTTSIGIAIAFQFTRSRKTVLLCIGAGILVPLLLLFLRY